MSERDLIQELKSSIKDLSDEKDDLLKTIKQKESRIKTIMIKLEHATQDVDSVGHKIGDQNKEIAELKDKIKTKDKVVKAEIDEVVEKYITTHSTVEKKSNEPKESNNEEEDKE